jgi:hypothetical protein
MKKIQWTILAAALGVASSASASFLTVVIKTPSPAEIVNLVVAPVGTSTVPAFSGGVYAGIYNETINGVYTSGFCIDVAHDVSVNETFSDYSYAALANAPDYPGGPMTSLEAADIEKLWAAYYPTAVTDTSGLTAAALQLAIWETEGDGKTLGNGDPGYLVTASNYSGYPGVIEETATMLGSLAGLTTEADLIAVVSPDGQSYVIAVPEPTTLISGALLLLPFGASTLRILRRNRAV